MKRILLIIGTLAVAASCSGEKNFDATGTFEATEVTVSSEANGRILSLNIEEGDSITANTQIGAIDSVQLYLTKMQLQKSGHSVSASRPDISKQIAATKEQIAKQKREKHRIENLLKAGAATTKQLDDINSYIRVLENQLAAQMSSLRNSAESIDAQSSAVDIQIAQAEDRLSKCRIVSPVSGTILDKYAEAGELASAGRPLFKVADLSKVYVRAYVTSAQLSKVKIGQKVNITAQFGGKENRKYEGRITWISNQSEFTPKSIQTNDTRADLVYAIKASVENDGYIKIGTYAEVRF